MCLRVQIEHVEPDTWIELEQLTAVKMCAVTTDRNYQIGRIPSHYAQNITPYDTAICPVYRQKY